MCAVSVEEVDVGGYTTVVCSSNFVIQSDSEESSAIYRLGFTLRYSKCRAQRPSAPCFECMTAPAMQGEEDPSPSL